MSLRPGDTVSMTLRAPVQLTRYQILHSSATLTRTLGNDPAADVAAMRKDLRRLYHSVVHDDLTLLGEMTGIIENGSIDDLVDHALRNSNPDVKVSSKTARPSKSRKA